MNIKIFTSTLMCLAGLTFGLQAQDTDQDRTLFNGGSLESMGFMIAPSYGYTQIDGAGASLINVRAGVILKDKFTVGAFYGLSINDIDLESETVPDVYLDFRSYGAFVEYTLRPASLIHVSFPLFIGGGEVEMDDEVGSAGLGEEHFFLLEPGAMLELNLHKNIRLNMGTTYRFVGDMNYRNIDQQDISGFTGQVGLKFVIF